MSLNVVYAYKSRENCCGQAEERELLQPGRRWLNGATVNISIGNGSVALQRQRLKTCLLEYHNL